MERRGTDGRILDVNLAQTLLGTQMANTLRGPMKELGLQAVNKAGWNVYF